MLLKIDCQHPDCGTTYQIESAKIPLHGGKLTCRKCKQKINIPPRSELEKAAETTVATPVLSPKPAAAKQEPSTPQSRPAAQQPVATVVQKSETKPAATAVAAAHSNGKSPATGKIPTFLVELRQVVEGLQSEVAEIRSLIRQQDTNEQIAALRADIAALVESFADLSSDTGSAITGDPNEETAPETEPDDPPIEMDETNLAIFAGWFSEHDFTLKDVRIPQDVDGIYDRLAIELGEKFDMLSGVYEVIKRYVNSGNYFHYQLQEHKPEDISVIVNYCCKLTRYAFLRSKYKSSNPYNRRNRTIAAAPQRNGKVVNFFTGGWLERYVYRQICNLMEIVKVPYHAVVNPQISSENGDANELDILFLVNKQPLWIECKTNNYQDHIQKYADLRKRMNIPRDQAMLVVLGLDDKLAADLTDIWGLTVLNEKNFMEHVARVLRVLSGKTAANGTATDADADE